MSKIYGKAFFGNKIVPLSEAKLSVASSAVLYGLSVYTVFPVVLNKKGLAAFRLADHYQRLLNSAKIIGIDTFRQNWTFEKFKKATKDLAKANKIKKDSFFRATIHVSDLLPGTRSKGLATILSLFASEASPIIPQHGARLKTSLWRRTPDYAIPSRAKVNGAYINSVLGKQDALDSGYDDCIFLDAAGHVCELSAANIFLIRNGILITPSPSNDILEGINRKTIFELARNIGIAVSERAVDLTELYSAEEVFACGTSSFVAPIIEMDSREVGSGKPGPLTLKIKDKYFEALKGENSSYLTYLL